MEHRKKCKVCGTIWCYTDSDVLNESLNSIAGVASAIGTITSAVGGNIFEKKYYADRMENIDRRKVNLNQCPNCHSLENEEISAEELENYKLQESFAKAQVSINSNATIESLLTRAKLLLEDGDWPNANAYCDNVLDVEPENGTAYLYKLMAELRARHQEELKDKAVPFDDKTNYQKVMRYADDTLKQTLTSYIEHINTRNETDRLQGIYDNAFNRMNRATTESECKNIAKIFESIITYKDSGVMQKKCLEKAEQLRLETERKTIEEKAKKKKNITIASIVLIIAVFSIFFMINNSQKQAAYNDAIALTEAGEHIDAIATFSKLGNYKDSATRLEALQEDSYAEIFALLDTEQYNEAYELCKNLGAYKDCPELAEQIALEYDKLSSIYGLEKITDESIESAKTILNENKYVKNQFLSQSVYLYEYFDNANWECISGDTRTLSMAYNDERKNNTWPTIITELSNDFGWDAIDTITIRHNNQAIKLGISDGSTFKYNDTTHSYTWTENAFMGADYNVTFYEQGTLEIKAICSNGSVVECKYKQID